MSEPLAAMRGGLIVSCQAPPGSPLAYPEHLAALAAAAEIGGAVAVRANGPANVAAVTRAVSVPVIGLYKVVRAGSEVYITPTPDDARAIVRDCDYPPAFLAFDATHRPRPNGLTWREVLRCIQQEIGALALADVSTLDEGLSAAEEGADIIATTLSGYTAATVEQYKSGLPDLELVRQLVARLDCPVFCEGRIHSPALAAEALSAGAYAVVVGAAITGIEQVTRTYVTGMRRSGLERTQ